MSKIIAIIKREFITRVASKGFIIGTLLTPLLFGSFAFVPSLLMQLDAEDGVRILVSDKNDYVYNQLVENLADTLSSGEKRFDFSRNDALEELDDATQASIEEGVIDAYVYVPPVLPDSGVFYYYSKNVSNFDVTRPLRNQVSQQIVNFRVAQYDLDPTLINQLTRWVDMKTIKIRKGEAKESGFGKDLIVSYIFVFLLYITIIIYGQTIGRGVLEEKQNRIVEIILSSANATQMMAGKLIGIGGVGLFQYLIWTLLFGGIMVFGVTMLPPEMRNAIQIEPVLFIYFILFFVLGYLLFSTLYVAVASMVNSEEEFQQLSMPIILVLIAPLMLMMLLIKDPNSNLAMFVSLFPFTSPMLMMMRVSISTPETWEIIVSIGLLVVTTWLLIRLAAKIYRVGILMYGKRPNLPELIKWMKYK
jgi:ABC-2 type transport system permease protein